MPREILVGGGRIKMSKNEEIITYYFYCPNCKFEEIVEGILPNQVVPNIRGGYGTPIYHYECPICHNLDAGYMRFGINKMASFQTMNKNNILGA